MINDNELMTLYAPRRAFFCNDYLEGINETISDWVLRGGGEYAIFEQLLSKIPAIERHQYIEYFIQKIASLLGPEKIDKLQLSMSIVHSMNVNEFNTIDNINYWVNILAAHSLICVSDSTTGNNLLISLVQYITKNTECNYFYYFNGIKVIFQKLDYYHYFNYRNKAGHTALYYLACLPNVDTLKPGMILFFLEKESDLKLLDESSHNQFFVNAKKSLLSFVFNKNIGLYTGRFENKKLLEEKNYIINILLEQGLDLSEYSNTEKFDLGPYEEKLAKTLCFAYPAFSIIKPLVTLITEYVLAEPNPLSLSSDKKHLRV